MSKGKRAQAAQNNSRFIYRLSMERCRSYISHMQAILHICEGTTDDVALALQQMMHMLDLEISHSLEVMD